MSPAALADALEAELNKASTEAFATLDWPEIVRVLATANHTIAELVGENLLTIIAALRAKATQP